MAWNHYFNLENIFDFNEYLNSRGHVHANNQNPLWNLRERLFYVFFETLTTTYCSIIPSDYRKLLENVFLGLALVPLLVLIYVHTNFIQTPVNCLTHISNEWPRNGILRVELSFVDSNSNFYNTDKLCMPLYLSGDKNSVPFKKQKSAANNGTYFATNYDILDRESAFGKDVLFQNESTTSETLVPTCDYVTMVNFETEYVNHAVWPQKKYIIEYALEYGLLKLSPIIRETLKIPVLTVKLDPNDTTCFGNGISQFLLKYVVGFSNVLMSSLKDLVDKNGNKGFVRNVITGDQYRFINKTLNSTSYFLAACTMVAFTLCISMLLRYSHHQIFLFIVRMLQALEFNLNASFPAASLLTIIFALVGMEAVMCEFFHDNTTAFYIILIVWIADQYDTIFCHHPITKRHWLRFFYLYHFAFYAYDYRFNGQYSGLALFTSWMFIQHSMVYFFHHFELPLMLPNNENAAESSIPPIANYSIYLRQQSRSNELNRNITPVINS